MPARNQMGGIGYGSWLSSKPGGYSSIHRVSQWMHAFLMFFSFPSYKSSQTTQTRLFSRKKKNKKANGTPNIRETRFVVRAEVYIENPAEPEPSPNRLQERKGRRNGDKMDV
jgi:hypothetical protein